MATRRLAAATAAAAAVLAAWRLHGLVLVNHDAQILADGTAAVLVYTWPVLVAAAAAAVAVAGCLASRAATRQAESENAEARLALERNAEQLAIAKRFAMEKEQAAVAAIRQAETAGRKEYAAVVAERQTLEQQRQYIERLEGELRGARSHIKRIKAKRQLD